ncbi:MAG: peroxide stress protein YaaA [Saprospiraceae bacterium]|nr:peroxide stress protein YaaA [Saprospiraceae bacterium]
MTVLLISLPYMIAIISPSKTLDTNPVLTHTYSEPRFLAETKYLVQLIKQRKPEDLIKLMGISEKLSIQNYQRYKSFTFDNKSNRGKVAVLTFKGEVYIGLKAMEMDAEDLDFAQSHLRILSGLYGLLKPLDYIQEYRLEMGTPLENKKGKNLYAFWTQKVTNLLNKDITESKSTFVINLASNEYIRVIDKNALKAKIIDIQFLEDKNGIRSFVSFNAKKARGMMASYMINNKLNSPELLKKFNVEGYVFDEKLSGDLSYTFIKY